MKLTSYLLLTFVVSALPHAGFCDLKKPLKWQINNNAWTKSMDKSYEEFIAGIGRAKKRGICHTTSACIKNRVANPKYFALNPDKLVDVYSDCADLPYILKAYFSWMNDLPFTYPTALTPAAAKGPEANALVAELDELYKEYESAGFLGKASLRMQINWFKKKRKGDIRYNRFGNMIVEKRYVKNGDNINDVLREVAESISTATFRTNGSNNTTNELFRDTYPVSVSRSSIKPGTVLYDPNGHVAVVFEVTDNGKIHLIDAHPDNSLTAITYGEKFSQTDVEIGGGFSNWRPFSVEGGRVLATANERLADYSLEQFNRKKNFVVNGQTMDFHEYVRNKLSVGVLTYRPLVELKELLEELCNDVKERDVAVKAAIAAGMNKQSHPGTLPNNIYGTDGDWELYSTPSRDARLKASVREGRALMVKMMEESAHNSGLVEYDGVDLKGDLKRSYDELTRQCTIEIKKNDGKMQTLSLNEILKNIFKLSFDPYHCPELRWGLLDEQSLQSCNSSKDNMEWYKAEQGLRNFIDRDYSLQMGLSARELLNSPLGTKAQEAISIEDVLAL